VTVLRAPPAPRTAAHSDLRMGVARLAGMRPTGLASRQLRAFGLGWGAPDTVFDGHWEIMMSHFGWDLRGSGEPLVFHQMSTFKNTLWVNQWLCSPEEIPIDDFLAWCPRGVYLHYVVLARVQTPNKFTCTRRAPRRARPALSQQPS